jgi:hypothetical protein
MDQPIFRLAFRQALTWAEIGSIGSLSASGGFLKNKFFNRGMVNIRFSHGAASDYSGAGLSLMPLSTMKAF